MQAEWAQAVGEESRLLRAHQLRLETELQAAQAAAAAAAAAAAPAVADAAHARRADMRVAAKGSCAAGSPAAACADAAAPAESSGAAAEPAAALAACAETNAGAAADNSRRAATGDAAASSAAAAATEASGGGTRGVPEPGDFGAGGSVGSRAARAAGCAGGAPASSGAGGWELAELRDSLAQQSGLTQVRVRRCSARLLCRRAFAGVTVALPYPWRTLAEDTVRVVQHTPTEHMKALRHGCVPAAGKPDSMSGRCECAVSLLKAQAEAAAVRQDLASDKADVLAPEQCLCVSKCSAECAAFDDMNAPRQELASGLKAAQRQAAALRQALAIAEAEMSSLRARLAARAPGPGGGSGGDGAGGAGDVSYEALQQQVVQVRDERGLHISGAWVYRSTQG